MTELRICISKISNTVVFLLGLFILLLKRARLNNTKCKADGREENFFYDIFFLKAAVQSYLKVWNVRKISRGDRLIGKVQIRLPRVTWTQSIYDGIVCIQGLCMHSNTSDCPKVPFSFANNAESKRKKVSLLFSTLYGIFQYQYI